MAAHLGPHLTLPPTDPMAPLEDEERVARLAERARTNIANASRSGITNRAPKGPSRVVLPPLPNAHLPAHLRVQSCLQEWSGLGDRYVTKVVRHGLRLDWAQDFDGEGRAPAPTYENSMTRCLHVRRLLKSAAKEGTLMEVAEDQLKCVSAPFAIDKKHAPGKESKRLILNLRNVNMWVRTKHFALPSLWRILPYLRKGQWACVIDLKGAYNHLPFADDAKQWMGVRNGSTLYQCQSLPFGLICAPRE